MDLTKSIKIAATPGETETKYIDSLSARNIPGMLFVIKSSLCKPFVCYRENFDYAQRSCK